MIRAICFYCEMHALGGKVFGCYPYLTCLVSKGFLDANHHSAAAGCFVFMVPRKASRSGNHSLLGIETLSRRLMWSIPSNGRVSLRSGNTWGSTYQQACGIVEKSSIDENTIVQLILLPCGDKELDVQKFFMGSYLVDPASSHMLVSKIKPCMS